MEKVQSIDIELIQAIIYPRVLNNVAVCNIEDICRSIVEIYRSKDKKLYDNRGQPQIIQSLMTIINDKEFMSWKLDESWSIVLTENPSNENYSVQEEDAAQKSRMLKWDVRYDNEIWCNWALKNNIDERCVNFIIQNGSDIFGKNDALNARIVTKFFDVIKYISDFSTPKSKAFIHYNAASIIPGDKGNQFASLFLSFIDNKLDKLPSPKELLSYKKEEQCVKILTSLLGEGEGYRSDISCIMLFRIANYLVSSKSKIPEIQVKNAAAILNSDKINDDLVLGICDKIASSNSKIISRLLSYDGIADKILL